jgi:excisionase family DNA binding protein
MADDSEFISVTDMAKRLGISRSMGYRLVEQNEVPHVDLGRVIRIPRKEFEAWLDAKKAPAAS